jgi:hypothetical protein
VENEDEVKRNKPLKEKVCSKQAFLFLDNFLLASRIF